MGYNVGRVCWAYPAGVCVSAYEEDCLSVRALPCFLEICAFAEKVQVIVPTHGLAFACVCLRIVQIGNGCASAFARRIMQGMNVYWSVAYASCSCVRLLENCTVIVPTHGLCIRVRRMERLQTRELCLCLRGIMRRKECTREFAVWCHCEVCWRRCAFRIDRRRLLPDLISWPDG